MIVMLVSVSVQASVGDTFTALTDEGVSVTFSVTSKEKKTCQVGTGLAAEKCVSTDTRGMLTIPRYANGYEVTAIAPSAFSYCTLLTSVILPDGIREIGSEAFQGCEGLKDMVLPSGLRTISAGAFTLSGIHEITIPSGVESIEGNPFPNVSALTVALDNSVYSSPEGSNAVIEKSTLSLVAGCEATVIPSGVRTIGACAFNYCRLKAVAIPESVVEIGDFAFYMSGLEAMEVPPGVKAIGSSCFEHCASLSAVMLSEGVESLGARCFRGCSSLQTVNLPGSLRSMGRSAFEGCLALEEIVIPEGVEEIPPVMFGGCSALHGIKLPESLRRINDMAFYSCESLDSISLPSGLTEIGRAVFGEKPLSAYHLFCETPPVSDETTFMGNYESRLYVPEGTAAIYKTADVWRNFKDIVEFNTNRITTVDAQACQKPIHDLQGRRLSSPPDKGVYILDGKKYVK